MTSKKQSWMMRHPSVKGARIIEIVRYPDPDKLLNQIFYGSVPDGFEVSFNTADRIELTLNGEVGFHLEPIRPLAIPKVQLRKSHGEWSDTDPRDEPGWGAWLESRKVHCQNAGFESRVKTRVLTFDASC